MRKPCTEQDYYDIRTACDNEHKVGDPVSLQFLSPEETAGVSRGHHLDPLKTTSE